METFEKAETVFNPIDWKRDTSAKRICLTFGPFGLDGGLG